MAGYRVNAPSEAPSSLRRQRCQPCPTGTPNCWRRCPRGSPGGQQRAIAAANQELLATYWAIGAEILARQDQQGWGAKIIDRLSADLRERFPDARGYSP